MIPRDYYIIYPVPLLGGMVAKLELPRLLMKDDAEKIVRVVMALVAQPDQTAPTTVHRGSPKV